MQEGENYDKIWNKVLMYVLEKRKQTAKLEFCEEVEFVNVDYNHSSASNDEISEMQSNSSMNDYR